MVRKAILSLLCLGILAACGSTHEDYAIKDPIFEGQDNYIIYRSDGTKGYTMKDPVFEDEDNFILFRER